MGRFVNWMMQRGDDGDDRNERDGRYSEYSNFDRMVANRRDYQHDERKIDNRRPNEYRSDNRGPDRDRYPSSYDRPMDRNSDRRERRDKKSDYDTLPLMSGTNGTQNVVIYSPKTYEDVQTLIDYLKRREPAVVNLAGINPDSAQRILDFMSGAIYGLSGSIHKISGSIFLLTPEGVSIMVPVDIQDDLEKK